MIRPPMREKVTFLRKTFQPDGSGGRTSADVEVATVRAAFTYEKGGEAVQAGGLTGTATFKVRIRSASITRGITPEDTMRDERTGVTFNIREVDPITDQSYVWLKAESGVAK